MATDPTNIKPFHSEWLIQFMSAVELNEKNKALLTIAILSYHEKCLKAAKELEEDLKNIPGVKIREE